MKAAQLKENNPFCLSVLHNDMRMPQLYLTLGSKSVNLIQFSTESVNRFHRVASILD